MEIVYAIDQEKVEGGRSKNRSEKRKERGEEEEERGRGQRGAKVKQVSDQKHLWVNDKSRVVNQLNVK